VAPGATIFPGKSASISRGIHSRRPGSGCYPCCNWLPLPPDHKLGHHSNRTKRRRPASTTIRPDSRKHWTQSGHAVDRECIDTSPLPPLCQGRAMRSSLYVPDCRDRGGGVQPRGGESRKNLRRPTQVLGNRGLAHVGCRNVGAGSSIVARDADTRGMRRSERRAPETLTHSRPCPPSCSPASPA
jgi:hypothetical protein